MICWEDFLGLYKSTVGFCRRLGVLGSVGEMARTGRPRAKLNRTATLKAAAYPTELADFSAACRSAKVPPADVLRELASAWAEFVAEHPRASMHFKIIPRA